MDCCTVDPGVTDDGSAFRELELGNLGLHALIFQGYLLHQEDLLGISRTMDALAKADIASHPLPVEVDDGLVEFVLSTTYSVIHRSEILN